MGSVDTLGILVLGNGFGGIAQVLGCGDAHQDRLRLDDPVEAGPTSPGRVAPSQDPGPETGGYDDHSPSRHPTNEKGGYGAG